ncbi:4Fe-4S binding protein [Tissierella sp. MSJ-40]|uniref:4Fe-4S binding protein n=1 Tax=Tissierella simiarum TaxID=2841534 RepID=A0ABS6E7G0_9FIRM|nr:4Fe-4S binding protein [Tissierella simiarum]MBU5438847.1 4Fe-4S binding protein [Tissierella simiarum]
MANNNKPRHIIQLFSTIATNGHLKGFFNGKLYKGNIKRFCVPGLNCYSCPGALGACPIGSMQAVIGSMKYNFSYYVLGIISLFGVILGRFICGWLCPFGFVQDLLHKIPSPKLKVPPKVHSMLKYLKYVILLLFVIILPFVFQDELGISDPYFCKYICPSGTLFGGIPLLSLNPSLRSGLGFLFNLKLSILIAIILLSVFIYRVFCKYLCPLGAFYAVFNPISLYKINIDEKKCISCDICTKTCKMNVEVYKKPNDRECIRCGDCVKACPKNAIKSGIK